MVYEEELPEIISRDEQFTNVEWKEMLNSLDEHYRLVMILYYVEGLKTGEISRILDIPESTVRTRLSRGREKLSVIYRIGDERGVVL